MKKLVVVLIALLFATGAFAQEAKKADFNYSVYGSAFGVVGSNGDTDYDYQHIRVRPLFSIGNENIKAVVRLEIDQDYGKTDPEQDGQYDGADAGTDNKVVEVKWAYLQLSDLLVKGLTFTTGLKDYYYPVIVDNDLALDAVTYDFGAGSLTLGYAKMWEYNVTEKDAGTKDNADGQTYIADLTVKAGPVTLRPAVFYLQSGKQAIDGLDTDYDGTLDVTLPKMKIFDYAINGSADFGVVALDGTFSYMTGKVVDSSTKVAGYAYDVAATFKPAEGISFALFTTFNSGQDNGNKYKCYNLILDQVLGAPDGRLYLLEAGGVEADGGHQRYDTTAEFLGYVSYGLSAEATIIPKVKINVLYGYASYAEKDTAGDTFIGHEFDGKLSYEAAPGTVLFLEAGYIKAGDVMTDDAKQIAWGLQTKI